MLEKMEAIGFSKEVAAKYKNRYDIQRLERNLSYSLAKQKEGLVKDLPSYLNKAITEDLGKAWVTVESQKKDSEKQRQDELQKRESLADKAHQERIASLLKG